jgi:hypothetical protein
MSPILGQANPAPMSQLGWILSTQNSLSALLVLLSAAAIFGGACYLVRSQRPASVLAAYLVLLPLPCMISLYGWIDGSVRSFSVLAQSPNITPTSTDIFASLAASLVGLEIAVLVSAPSYFLLAYGLLIRTMQPPTNSVKNVAAGATPPVASLNRELPINAPILRAASN